MEEEEEDKEQTNHSDEGEGETDEDNEEEDDEDKELQKKKRVEKRKTGKEKNERKFNPEWLNRPEFIDCIFDGGQSVFAYNKEEDKLLCQFCRDNHPDDIGFLLIASFYF